MSQSNLEIIQACPIDNALDEFCQSFDTSQSLDTLNFDDLQELASKLLSVLSDLEISRRLPSKTNRKTLRQDLLTLIVAVESDGFDIDRIKPLLNAVFANKPDQEIWDRRDIDSALKRELGVIHFDVPQIHNKFFGGVAKLETTSQAFFEECSTGTDPSFIEGWVGWPIGALERDVLNWLETFIEKLATFAQDYRVTPTRRIIANPNKPVTGSVSTRKLDIGFVNNTKKDTTCHWSQILIPGELKSNPAADTHSHSWLDLGRYAREVFSAQDTRRFVLGFTCCGSFMRIWKFDRLGAVSSEKFDINKEGLLFVSTILGFLWADEEELEFDSTIKTAGSQRFIEIERKDGKERLVIDKLMIRTSCVIGRATTCWKAHHDKHPSIPLVIKDSWQYSERDEEGELLCEASQKNVVNVARYYHHETVRILGMEDDIVGNIRKGTKIPKASNLPQNPSAIPRNMDTAGTLSNAGQKRSSSQASILMPPTPSKRPRLAYSSTTTTKAKSEPPPPSKRSHSAPSSTTTTKAKSEPPPNRIHRRVIVSDYGEPIYTANSLIALLTALEGCIEGHESLYNAGFLHRDISINNLMINEDKNNSSWPSFLIDLDSAIKVDREVSSGAKGRTGTRAFMAIGILKNELHSFMHDLESFFWVIFWICIHYKGPGKSIGATEYNDCNFQSDNNLSYTRRLRFAMEEIFLK
ncbi:serine/threonine-protein kinase Sgk2 [Sclerotinia borealis F-4128]|uniref:non-specific serine/threonine protein kinase n=1 Tax=Sclerotinia borealis (strain F-4128) TaxID=1432307 RepID=W9CIN5_SCLBF|nr:serine/threonine-protein kinase Sgk2 [Sclerotinia borealis F-4128]